MTGAVPKRKAPIADRPQKMTRRKLASILGVKYHTLSWHIRNSDTPDLADIEGWKAFLAERGRAGTSPVALRESAAEAKTRLLKAQADRVERENQEAASQLVPIEAVRQGAQIIMGELFSNLERLLFVELPPVLAGLRELEIRDRNRKELEALKDILRIRFDEAAKAQLLLKDRA